MHYASVILLDIVISIMDCRLLLSRLLSSSWLLYSSILHCEPQDLKRWHCGAVLCSPDNQTKFEQKSLFVYLNSPIKSSHSRETAGFFKESVYYSKLTLILMALNAADQLSYRVWRSQRVFIYVDLLDSYSRASSDANTFL